MSVGDEIDDLEDGEIALVIADADTYVQTNMDILQHLTAEDDMAGIYVTINKPYTTMTDILEDHGVDTDRIFFVDAISKETGGETVDRDHVLFMDAPDDLTGMSIVVSKAVDSMPEGKKFVFLDSLTTLTVYNETDTVTQFAHFLTGKMRRWDVAGVILSLEEEADEELIAKISQFCDKTVRV